MYLCLYAKFSGWRWFNFQMGLVLDVIWADVPLTSDGPAVSCSLKKMCWQIHFCAAHTLKPVELCLTLHCMVVLKSNIQITGEWFWFQGDGEKPWRYSFSKMEMERLSFLLNISWNHQLIINGWKGFGNDKLNCFIVIANSIWPLFLGVQPFIPWYWIVTPPFPHHFLTPT